MIRRVIGIYFSPVGGTAKMTKSLSAGIAANLADCCPIDITYESYNLISLKDEHLELDEETIAVIGMPVYIGKVPLPAVEMLKKIEANGATAIATVSYGGRSFGNALYELQHEAEEIGFNVIGAGAFSIKYNKLKNHRSRHLASVNSLAANSLLASELASNEIDNLSLKKFCTAASNKIKRLAGCDIDGMKVKPAPLEVVGKLPVHGISKISPRAAAMAQELLEKLNVQHKDSEWFL